MTSSDPMAIYAQHLAATSPAAMAGDFTVVLANIAIPSQLIMADREVVISSTEELELALHDYALRLQIEGVIDEIEGVIEAAFVPGIPDLIAGSHQTEWRFADGRPPRQFRTRILLMRYATGWKMIWLQTDLACDAISVISAEFAAAQIAAFKHLSGGRH